MVPSIEGLEQRPLAIMSKLFVVDLDTPSPLNLEEFDQQAQRIAGDERAAVLKWLVRGSRMFIFYGFEHSDMNEILVREGNGDSLFSAGRLMVTRHIRRVRGNSDTLAETLSIRESNLFKINQLAPKLGEGFQVD